MSSFSKQTEEEFIAASHEVLQGRSIESTVSERPELTPEAAEMLMVVDALKKLPTPAISSEAMARVQQHTQVLAQNRREVGQRDSLSLPRLSVVRANSTNSNTANSDIRRTALRAVALVAILVLAALSMIGLAALQGRFFNSTPQIESYTGVIARIEGNNWIMADNAEMIINDLTEVHGIPTIGSKMICIAEQLPGHERYRALEVWIVHDPESYNFLEHSTRTWI